MQKGFVFLDEVLPEIRWDAKYATWDNFTGKPVDGYEVNRIVGTHELAAALHVAQEQAAVLGYGLLLWDGYRPQRAVDRFLKWSEEPEDGRTKSKHYPNINRSEMIRKGYVAAQSSHSRGSAIDLTLYRLDTNVLVPMGGDFDLMDVISHHEAKGITEAETENRRLLRSIMESSGFNAYDYEWWHYTLKNEPYPSTYFDFPISLAREKGITDVADVITI
ncbi:D-Ala-D-Ala dipeptidase VanX [Paenibacillus macerans]|uniref:D-Ala-D-Ala dipeptidase VanX n=1 Tax=Paenibacillus macerans TaxID=44252 RepID=UPI000EC65187|nr:D-Ala-D-Ala dipeptidase VanX [Paenibacillus macerans]MBS5914985.1 D-Ala-D-Ala dipeptidase VanX [Paenibacillus macerans]MDU5948509.1 D-Ala-D-Ala dipeptidase VanX [Paenibacillus macerans]GBK61724.1 D-Ala-D-Ala dipeptidase VanX [Paenibacillus macerans]GBK68030.1 D-Ala-D-Ala dipeptidase VanX [Paenibacillus macerans]GIP11112.1 D-Ala-D-Ala dipeptidase VanX [Paenibacillus macerans]